MSWRTVLSADCGFGNLDWSMCGCSWAWGWRYVHIIYIVFVCRFESQIYTTLLDIFFWKFKKKSEDSVLVWNLSFSMNTGLFTPSATMAQQLETAAQIAGEKIWRMPLVEPYALPTILQSGNTLWSPYKYVWIFVFIMAKTCCIGNILGVYLLLEVTEGLDCLNFESYSVSGP